MHFGDTPGGIAEQLGARSRPHWWRELVNANPQLHENPGSGNFDTFSEGSTINIPDAWGAAAQSPRVQPAPGLRPAPSPAPVVPGALPAFGNFDQFLPLLSGVMSSVPKGSVLKGASVDPGVLLRVEGQLWGWSAINPGASGCNPDFNHADVDGVITDRTTTCMAAWERWHNARGESPLPTDGLITPASALALNEWWESGGHELAEAAWKSRGKAPHAPRTQTRPAAGPLGLPDLGGVLGGLGSLFGGSPSGTPSGIPDLGWLAAQAQQQAQKAGQLAQQAVQQAGAGGNTPDLQNAAMAAQQAAAKAAADAQRAVADATQQGARGGALPDLGPIAAQAQQVAQQAAQQAQQAAQLAGAGGNTPDLQNAAMAAQQAAAKAAADAQRAVADATRQATQQGGAAARQAQAALPVAKKTGGTDIVPLVSIAAALLGAFV